MTKLSGIGGIGLTLGFALVAQPAMAQFSVEPAIVRLESEAGAVEQTLILRHEGSTPREFRIAFADFEQDEQGGHEFLEAGSYRNSCVKRLSVFPERFSLLPNETQEIRVRLDTGAETCWSLVLVESMTTGTTGIRYGEQIAVKVFGGASTAVREASITEVTAEESNGEISVALAMQNESTIPLQTGGFIEIRDLGGELVGNLEVTPFSVLPGRTRKLVVAGATTLPAGDYLAVPILDFGGDYLAAAQAIVTVH